MVVRSKKFYKIKVSDGTVCKYNYTEYNDFVIERNKLYAFKYNNIVELHPSHRTEIITLKSVGSKYLKNMFYLNSTNEIAGDLVNSSTHNVEFLMALQTKTALENMIILSSKIKTYFKSHLENLLLKRRFF